MSRAAQVATRSGAAILFVLCFWHGVAVAASLDLQITDPATSEPMAGVKLGVRVDGVRQQLSTDEQGRARITWEKSPTYLLSIVATKDRYVPTTIEWRSDGKSPVPKVPAEVAVAMAPAITVGGVVQDEQGKAIAGAELFLSISDTKESSKVPPGTPFVAIWDRKVTSDASGRWNCDFAPANWYLFNVRPSHPDFISPTFEPTEQPTAEALRAKNAVTVMKRGVIIAGKVVDAQGKPVKGALLAYDFEMGSRFPTTRAAADGTFRFLPSPPGQHDVYVRAPNFAPKIAALTANEDIAPLEIRMAPSKPIRGKLVDGGGNPVGGATVIVTGAPGRNLTFAGDRVATAADGRFRFDSDGEQPLYIDVLKRGVTTLRSYKLDPKKENIVSFGTVLRVSGTVSDAESGKPIEKIILTPGSDYGDRLFWGKPEPTTAPTGRYSYTFDDGRGAGDTLRVGAEGYQPVDSPRYQAGQGEVTFDVKLKKAKPIAGVLLTPDGKPAQGAEVTLAMATSQTMIRNGRLSKDQNFSPTTSSDEQGRFSFNQVNEKWILFALHDAGYARLNGEELSASEKITLVPWGRIEGTLKIGVKPVPNGRVSLRMTQDQEDFDMRDQRGPRVSTYYDVTTDENAHFVLDRVPAGEGKLFRYLQISQNGPYTGFGSTSPASFSIKPGERLTLDVGGTGRAVIGRAVVPATWSKGSYQFSTASIQARETPVGPKRPENFKEMTAEERRAFRDSYAAWMESAEGKAALAAQKLEARRRPYYQTAVGADGTFRFDDVLPGEYTLFIRAETSREAASDAMINFTVAPMPGGRSDEAQDLGEVIIGRDAR